MSTYDKPFETMDESIAAEKRYEIQHLPYMGKRPPTAEEIKRKNFKSPVAIGRGTKKTGNHIKEDWLE